MTKSKLPGLHHLDPKLQLPWNIAQVGTLILPLMPALGAVSLGLALLITWAFKYRTIIRRPRNWGFAIFSLLLIITTVLAYDKISALEGIFNFLPFVLLFCAFDILIQTPAQLRHLAWILVITSIPVAIIGLGQMFLNWVTPQIWQNIFGWNLAPGGNPVGRMASVFMYANILAGYLVIVFILACGLWLGEWEKGRRGEGEKGRRGKVKEIFFASPTSPTLPTSSYSLPFLTVAVILNFTALILTNSRNAWAIAIFACIAYAIYQGWRIIMATVATIASSVILAAFAPAPIAQFFRKIIPSFFWARLNDQMYPDRPIALMRKTQWEFAWSLTQQRPWTGWGLRNFTALYQEKMHVWLGHPHNFFLMLSAEAGIPNTLLFIGLILWILFAGLRLLQKSKSLSKEDKLILFGYLLVIVAWVLFNTVDVSLFDFRLNLLSWVLLGTVSGVISRYNHLNKFIDP
jgi:O-antigen ligase